MTTTTTDIDPFTGEITQLALFEGKEVSASRHTITGAFAVSELGPNPLPDMPLDAIVTLRVTGQVTGITYKRTKDGTLERQHVITLDDARAVDGSIVGEIQEHVRAMLPNSADSMTMTTQHGSVTITGEDLERE